MAVALDYCPICGARLRDDEPQEAHLDARPECRERFEGWRDTSDVHTADASGFSTVTGFVLVAIVAVVLGYSVLVAQQLLLGLLVSGVVVIAFVVGSRL